MAKMFIVLAACCVIVSGANVDVEDKLSNAEDSFSLVQTGNSGLARTMSQLEDAADMLGADGHGLMQRGSTRGLSPKHGSGSWGSLLMMLVFSSLCLVGARGAQGQFEADGANDRREAGWPASSLLALQRSFSIRKVPPVEEEDEGVVADTQVNPVLMQESMESYPAQANGRENSVLGLQRSVRVGKTRKAAELVEDEEEKAETNVGPVLLQEAASSNSLAASVLGGNSVLGLQRSVSIRKTASADLKEDDDEVADVSPGSILLQETMQESTALDAAKDASVLGLQQQMRLRKATVILPDEEEEHHQNSAPPTKGSGDLDAVDGMVVGLQRGLVVRKTLLAQEEDSDDSANGAPHDSLSPATRVWLQRSKAAIVKPKTSKKD